VLDEAVSCRQLLQTVLDNKSATLEMQ
jgi:hypothetical protein